MNTGDRVRKICIATWELKEFTPGGIGVLVHNILHFYGSDPRAEISILWYGHKKLDPGLFAQAHPNCRLFLADEWIVRDDDASPSEIHASSLYAQRQTLKLMRALKSIEAELGAFDFIEFPDFDGAALSSLQERRLGRAFQNTKIVVRIHSTEAVLRAPDYRPANPANAVRVDMERKALRDADLVVGHLQPVVDDVAAFFALGEAWRKKVLVEHPPVFVEQPGDGAVSAFGPDTPIVLTSKIQWFKRPSTFINGVVGFMRSHPDYKGDAYLLAHVIDAELRRHCIDLIPSEYATRIKLPDVVPNALRDKMISRSITVVPSAYESFCLAAYEASCLGALVVLNEENVAFGQDTPWRNGENCVKFDGTSHGLVAALASMWRDRVSLRLSKVELLPPQSPYWVASELSEPASAAVDQPSLSASAIVFSNDDYGDPLETIASLMLVSGVDLEITLVEEGPSRIAGREEVLSRLRHSPLLASGPIKIVTLGFHGGEAALINAGIQSSTRDIVVIARAGAKLDADYLRDSLRALVRSPDYDIVVSQRARDKSILGDTPPMFIGEALSSASGSNSCGEFEMVARRSVFQRVKFDEALDRFVDWDFHMRACIEGFRYIVANDAGVQLDSPRVRHGGNFRSHFENLLAKHSAVFPGGRISLVSVYEGKATEHPGRPPAEMLLLGRPVDYYTTEERPWWKLALLRPLRLPRWALLREFQRRKNKR